MMMKYVLTLTVALLLTIASFAGGKGYDLKIHVNGNTDSICYLGYYYGDKQYLIDTVLVKNGKFSFSGDEPLDGGIYLIVMDWH